MDKASATASYTVEPELVPVLNVDVVEVEVVSKELDKPSKKPADVDIGVEGKLTRS